MRLRFLLMSLSALSVSACATATRGTHANVRITSEPPNARAISDLKATELQTYEDGFQSQYYGCAPTPCSINLPRRSSPVIDVSKEGYDPIKFKIVSTWETGSASVRSGSIVAGMPPGSHVVVGDPSLLQRVPIQGGVLTSGLFTYGIGPVVDIASGANLSLSPNPVTVFLAPTIDSTNDPEGSE